MAQQEAMAKKGRKGKPGRIASTKSIEEPMKSGSGR